MSLKHFHVFFITFSSLLAFGFSVWCFGINTGGVHSPLLGVVSATAGVTLVLYGRWFIRMWAQAES